jgi:hypothetical protein
LSTLALDELSGRMSRTIQGEGKKADRCYGSDC